MRDKVRMFRCVILLGWINEDSSYTCDDGEASFAHGRKHDHGTRGAAHLAVIGIGANGYATLGAPAGLVAMVGTSSYRPAFTCVLIASLLMMGAIYGLSGAGLVTQLPGRRLILTLLGVGLVGRALLLPVAVAWQPQTLIGICGRCQVVNGFVLLTSALCMFVGVAYVAGANIRTAPAE